MSDDPIIRAAIVWALARKALESTQTRVNDFAGAAHRIDALKQAADQLCRAVYANARAIPPDNALVPAETA